MCVCVCVCITYILTSHTESNAKSQKYKTLKLNILMFTKIHTLMLNKRVPLPLTQWRAYISSFGGEQS